MNQQVKLGFVCDRTDSNDPIIKLKTIQLADGKRNGTGPVFVFAEGDQSTKTNHANLMALPSVKTALSGISKERNPFITLKTPVLEEYLDEDQNPQYKGSMLDELNEPLAEHSILNGSMSFSSQTEQLLAQQVANLQKQLEAKNKRKDLHDLLKKFSLQEFKGKSDGRVFMRTFEEECLKQDIVLPSEKVTALKEFCKDTAAAWWDANKLKLSVENWAAWKTSFLTYFGPKSFREVRMAYNYVWKFGSFFEYAVEKERRLLELNERMSEREVVDNVVLGLPLYIQDELSRDELKTMAQLVTELTRLNPKPYHSTAKSASKSNNWREEPRIEQKKYEKEPCLFCSLLGYGERFHAASKCRNKSKAEELIKSAQKKPFSKAKVNLNEADGEYSSESSSSEDSRRSDASKSSRSSQSSQSEQSPRSGKLNKKEKN